MNVTIRPRTLEDDLPIVEIRNESRPWLPPATLEEYRWQADPANSPPGEVNERWVALSDGEIVGLYAFGQLSFLQRANTFGANIGVARAHRHRGVGGQLYAHLMTRTAEHSASRIYCHVSEDDPEAMIFAETRGFTKTGRAGRLSRLDVDKAKLDGYDGIVQRLKSEGIELKTLAEVGLDDRSLLEKIHGVWQESARDIPSSEEFSGWPFETWLKWQQSPGNAPDQSWVAFEGDRPVGVASVSRRGGNSSFNNYTGVDRAYRGRGVARALKLKTLEFLRANGIESIFTENDTGNKAMLSINIPMGYEAVPAELEFVKDL